MPREEFPPRHRVARGRDGNDRGLGKEAEGGRKKRGSHQNGRGAATEPRRLFRGGTHYCSRR